MGVKHRGGVFPSGLVEARYPRAFVNGGVLERIEAARSPATTLTLLPNLQTDKGPHAIHRVVATITAPKRSQQVVFRPSTVRPEANANT